MNCKKLHTEIPDNARAWKEWGNENDKIIAYVWECQCKSTLFAPTGLLILKEKL